MDRSRLWHSLNPLPVAENAIVVIDLTDVLDSPQPISPTEMEVPAEMPSPDTSPAEEAKEEPRIMTYTRFERVFSLVTNRGVVVYAVFSAYFD